MIITQENHLFTELITEESAVVSGGNPLFFYDGKTAKILDVDGHGKEEILYQYNSYYNPDRGNSDYLSLPSTI
jgi:hypothetical protein